MAKSKRLLTWVATAGGPHLVVAVKHSTSWKGVNPPPQRIVKATFRCDPSEPATDYDRACDVDDWQGVLRVGRGHGLVLGGTVATAAFYQWKKRTFILRWLYAPSEARLLTLFRDVCNTLTPAEEGTLRHPGGDLLMFDAGDTPPNWLFEFTSHPLSAGRYRVTASYYEEDDVSFVAHEWVRMGK